MEQSRRTKAHLERVLFVSGLQNAGKSTMLRRMFDDPRLGTRRSIPRKKRLGFVPLSRERCLYFRLSSPHEAKDSLQSFLKKLDRAMERAWDLDIAWRFNFACAIQPNATATTPDLVTICTEVHRRLIPERIRVVQINPQQDGDAGTLLTSAEIDRLWSIGVEVITADARRPAVAAWRPNGLLLADFFDFT